METYLDYSLQDLLLFSDDVYFRSLILYNAKLWPAQILSLLAGLFLLWVCVKQPRHTASLIGTVLALAWAICGTLFHLYHFQEINWLATIYGWMFVLQGSLIMLWCLCQPEKFEPINRGSAHPWTKWTFFGNLLILIAVCGFPFLTLLDGQPLKGGHLFALFPAPTILATLGVAFSLRKLPLILLIIPLIYAIIGFLTADLLGSIMSYIYLMIIGMLMLYVIIAITTNNETNTR